MGSQSFARSVRLAILECDTPVPAVQEKYNNGGYGAVFTSLFEKAVAPETLPSQLELSYHDVVNDFETAYPDPETLDAVLISGSKHNSYEDEEWILRLVEYVRKLVEGGRVRVIGVCFGHQILARAMGSKVGRSTKGWELAVVEMNLTEDGEKIFGRKTLVSHHEESCCDARCSTAESQNSENGIQTWLTTVCSQRIQQMHRDVVSSPPAGTVLLASTDACEVQGFYSPKRVMAVQGHPEFTAFIVSQLVKIRHDSKIFNDELYNDASSRAGNEHDGVLIAQAFLKFLRE